MTMKSIYFPPSVAGGMVRAILEGRKTVTRQVVKPQPTFFYTYGGRIPDPDNPDNIVFLAMFEKNGKDTEEIFVPPYQPDDILYVQETWAAWSKTVGTPPALYYRADGDAPAGIKWRPSIHMPREAARIFLRVTDVRAEPLQKIDDGGVVAEGLAVGDPFDELWDRATKKADRALYGWAANPWVWVIEFDRISGAEVTE